MSYLGDDPGIRVIHTHILVNVLLALLFVPMNVRIAESSRKILEAWKPEKLVPGPHTPGSSLDSEMVKKPAQAITCARREAFRLADNLEAMFAHALDMFGVSDRAVIEKFVSSDSEINARNRAIQEYLATARRHIDNKDGHGVELEKDLDNVLRFSATMENIGDVVSHNLARLAIKRVHRNVDFSSEGGDELTRIHQQILRLIQLEISRFASSEKNRHKAKSKMIKSIRELGKASIENHRKRVSNQKSASLSTTSIHQDALRDLLQVVSLVENISAG
jgi:phosphate:Na+ symporter